VTDFPAGRKVGIVQGPEAGTDMKKPLIPPSNAAQRAALRADLDAFLESGKSIQLIPTGQSGENVLASRRHIRLGQPKKS
jgi:hypothetical protein